jgi:hypothetical protein
MNGCCRFTSQRLIACVCVLAIFVLIGAFVQLLALSNETSESGSSSIDNSFASSALRLSRRRARERAADSHDEKQEYESLQKQARDEASQRRNAAAAAKAASAAGGGEGASKKRKLVNLKHQRLSPVTKLLLAPLASSSEGGSFDKATLETIVEAQDESMRVLISIGNESQVRTLNLRKTAPARLLSIEKQSSWGRFIGYGHSTSETEIIHPDVGRSCGSDELNICLLLVEVLNVAALMPEQEQTVRQLTCQRKITTLAVCRLFTVDMLTWNGLPLRIVFGQDRFLFVDMNIRVFLL